MSEHRVKNRLCLYRRSGEDAQEVLLRAYNNGLISDSEQIDILNTPKTAFNPNTLNDNIQSRNKENQHPVNSSAVVEKRCYWRI